MIKCVALAAVCMSFGCGADSGWRHVATPEQQEHPAGAYTWEDSCCLGRDGNATRRQDAGFTAINGTPDGRHLWLVGEQGLILRSIDWGATWRSVKGVTTEDLKSVFVSSNGQGIWAVGGESLLYSDDWGKHWNSRSLRANCSPRSITGSNDGRMLWVACSATVLFSQNGGRDWHLKPSPVVAGVGYVYEFFSIHSNADGSRLWAQATVALVPTVIHSRDGGASWESLSEEATRVGSVASSSAGSEIWLGPSGESDPGLAPYKDSNPALDSRIGYSNNGGKTWGELTLPARELISMHVDEQGRNLCAVGKDGSIVTGRLAGHYSEISAARLLSKPSGGARLELKLTPDQVSTRSVRIDVEAANDFNRSRHRFEYLKVHRTEQTDDPATWVYEFDPDSDADVRPGNELYLKLHLFQDKFTQSYPVLVLTYRPLSERFEPWLKGIALLLSIPVVLTVLLFTRPLWLLTLLTILRGLLRSPPQDTVKPPNAALKCLQTLLLNTILPWFAYHGRVLDAWVSKNAKKAQEKFKHDDAVSVRLVYVSLPIRAASVGADADELVGTPSPDYFRSLFSGERSIIQVVGRAGSGKSTLAFQIALALLPDRKDDWPKRSRRMLPVVVGEDTQDLKESVRAKLSGWLERGVDAELVDVLLRKRRLLVIFDGLTERTEDTQKHLRPIIFSPSSFNALVVTSSVAAPMSFGTSISTQSIEPTKRGDFLIQLLEKRKTKAFSEREEQFVLLEQLRNLIPRSDEEITPLLVSLFLDSALALVKKE